jgi:uncharacterized protein (DUF924 family)
VRERFGRFLPVAAAMHWDLAGLTREQSVALVVLFDQFPRNIFRSSGEAFAYDHLARDLARQLIAGGWDRFTQAEAFFLGLPFVHHENMDDQDYAVTLASQVSVADAHEQALKHRNVIRRFGRFPHRNAMIGRQSTPEELAFLETAERGRGF